MKKLIFLFVFINSNCFAQDKYITKTGVVNFEASAPSFEEVKAINNSVTAIIEVESGTFAALVLVKGFRFKNALMEEHFNENYAESTKFPKALFKGKITHVLNKYQIDGVLTFHGKSKEINIIHINYLLNDKKIELSGSFNVSTSDFDIFIPKIVKDKISEIVNVSFNFIMVKKE